ncbi:MAG TPA: ABC transporter permease [Nocardioidaceae bacterium]|nr:ABC transporter permease [Nocardioidaceae bacterium]
MSVAESTPGSRHGLELRDPGGGGGLLDVFRHRYLLKLLVRKEVKVRYQGTVLGMAWSYAKPLMRFFVYFVVIGQVLGLVRSIPNFAVHIVSGMVCVQLFNEVFQSTTNSVVRNKALVRKIFLPRELFPVASVFVSLVNIIPFLVVLLLASIATGWTPEWQTLPALVLGITLVAMFGMSLGLFFSGFNVYFRDFGKVVDVVTTLTPWSVPMIYAFDMIAEQLKGHSVLLELYLANPVAISGMLVQRAFWIPTVEGEPIKDPSVLELAPDLFWRGLILLAASVVILAVAQRVFKRLEGSFAEQL